MTKTCEFFARHTQNPNFGTCQSGKVIYINAYNIPKDQPTDVLINTDGDGFNSDPIMGKDYGCIHHNAGGTE